MECADVFLFTSNYLEGWGAVLNESMNSACAVVAGSGIGAVPFLLKHNYNGLVYKTGRYQEFERLVSLLCTDKTLQKRLGTHAYEIPKRRLTDCINSVKDCFMEKYSRKRQGH